MAKSKIYRVDGRNVSYNFNDSGDIVGVLDHSDPTNPTPVNPESKLYADQVRSNDALTAFNFNRYGGNKDSYEDSVELTPAEVAKDFYDKEVKDNKERLEEQNDAGLSNPSLAPGPASAYASYKRGQKTGNTDLFTYPLVGLLNCLIPMIHSNLRCLSIAINYKINRRSNTCVSSKITLFNIYSNGIKWC